MFDDTTPLELHLAMKDKSEGMSLYEFLHLDLLRLHAIIQRNKGVKEQHQVKRIQKFYEFPWERTNKKIDIPDWEALDKKYK